MKSESEIRAQLAETQTAIRQLQDQLQAALNQEWALQWALGLVPDPQAPAPLAENEDADGSTANRTV